MHKILLIAIIALLQHNSYSQFQHEPPGTIEAKTIQPEMQLLYENIESTNEIKSNNITHPSFLIRYGITDKLELQMNVQYLTEHVEEKKSLTATYDHKYNTGLQPVKTGLKFLFNEGENLIPSAGLLINLSIPKLASSDFQASYFAPEIIFCASQDIGNFSIGYNAGFSWDGELTEPYNIYVISFNYTPSDYFAIFAEAYGGLKYKSTADNRVDAGVSFFITDNFQLDLAAGFGLSKSSPANFLGMGMALHIPEL